MNCRWRPRAYLEIEIDGVKKKIGITRVHLEEDAGKLVHKGAARIMGAEESLVDYNRTGTPLMEIVSEPDIRSPKEAAIYTETLANLLRYLMVCDAKMEEGSLRCDANLSIRLIGKTEFGVKTEVKNMNSFRSIEKALLAEEKRHNEVISEGGKILQETRFFDDVTETTTGMRSKEYAHDYRYFPEPDLVPIEPDDKWVREIKAGIGELPWQRKNRFITIDKIKPEIANIFVNNKSEGDIFDESKNNSSDVQINANLIVGALTAILKEKGMTFDQVKDWIAPSISITGNYIHEGKLGYKMVNDVLSKIIETGEDPSDIIAKEGLTQISDEGELLKIVQEVVKNNPKQVEQYKAGKETVIMFLIGQVMKASKGKANPEVATRLLKQTLA